MVRMVTSCSHPQETLLHMSSGSNSRYPDNHRLLTDCLNGDEKAWTTLVDRYSRLVYSIAYRTGLDRDDADDAVQGVFTIVLRRLESLQDVDRFSSWIITVAHRECWRVAKTRRDTPLPDTHDPADPEPAIDKLVADWEQASLVHDALERLDTRCRTLIEMLFLREPRPPYDAISDALGIAVGSIGPIRARCLKRLRGHLASLGVIESAQ